MNDIEEKKVSSTQVQNFLLGIGLSFLLATATFYSGLHIGRGTVVIENQSASVFSFFRKTPQAPEDADLTEFWRVWNLMEQKFASASSTQYVSTADRIEGAIDGLVRAYGDPYTTYLPKTEAAMFDEDISGNFSGVGMEVGMRNGVITVIAPLAGTPAEVAGVQAGDYIVEIDGNKTDSMTVERAVRLIRGDEGTEVVLTLARVGELELIKKSITRTKIEIPTVKTELRDGIFIITLYSFNAIAEMKMQEALRAYVRSGAQKLVLDLRGNPGGFLQGAVSIASYFLPTGKVVLRESFGSTDKETVFRSSGKTLKQFAPEEMVVLIDGGSASASEILAGALGYHGYATIIGTPSFGKGSVQELVNLPTGAALKVTVARWLTPGGVSISEGGLVPDIVIKRTLEDREKAQDPQLDAAIQVLRGTFDFTSVQTVD
jgi:carboxyl-terminal processing protease